MAIVADRGKRIYRDGTMQRCGVKFAKRSLMESKWVYREMQKLEDFRGIGAEFGLQILERVLNELVDQLLDTSHEIFWLNRSFVICAWQMTFTEC